MSKDNGKSDIAEIVEIPCNSAKRIKSLEENVESLVISTEKIHKKVSVNLDSTIEGFKAVSIRLGQIENSITELIKLVKKLHDL